MRTQESRAIRRGERLEPEEAEVAALSHRQA